MPKNMRMQKKTNKRDIENMCSQKLTFCEATQGRRPFRIITKRGPERHRPWRASRRRRVGHGVRDPAFLMLLSGGDCSVSSLVTARSGQSQECRGL